MQKTLALLLTLSVLILAAGMSAAADRIKDDAERKQVAKKETKASQPNQPTADDIAVPARLDGGQASDTEAMTADNAAELMRRAIMAGEDINWQVIPGGGSINGTSTNFTLSGAVGQVAVGAGTSTNYSVNSGFWQNFQAISNECNMPGNANNDDAVNIGDIVYLISYIFRGGPPPIYINEGDVNEDCTVNLGDAVFLINFAFRSGPPPTCGCVFTK